MVWEEASYFCSVLFSGFIGKDEGRTLMFNSFHTRNISLIWKNNLKYIYLHTEKNNLKLEPIILKYFKFTWDEQPLNHNQHRWRSQTDTLGIFHPLTVNIL